MAIHPELHPSPGHLTPQQIHQISAWTEQSTGTVNVSPIDGSNNGRNTDGGSSRDVPLAIPLDDERPSNNPTSLRMKSVRVSADDNDAIPVVSTTYRRKDPIRRDSLKRRDALLKGKEGSRRRQRWENGMLA